METGIKKIISDYYTEIQRRFKGGELDFSRLHLDENVRVIGPNERFEGKQQVEEMFSLFISMVDRYELKRQYFDHDSCCTLLNCVTRSPALSILTVEWILIKQGKIVEIHPIYDTAAWAKVASPPVKN
jgi:hypothetical protein